MIESTIIYKTLSENDKNIMTSIDQPVYFADKLNQYIWKMALTRFNKSIPVTFEDIHIDINKHTKYKDELHSKLTEIENGVWCYDNEYVNMIKEDWEKRVFQNHGIKVAQTGKDNYSIKEAKEDIVNMYQLIRNIDDTKKDFITLGDIEHEIINRTPEEVVNSKIHVPTEGMQTIFGDVLHPRFYILAALRSLGKNIILDRLVADILPKYKVCYFSYDNSAKETAFMINSNITGVNFNRLETGFLNDWEKSKITLDASIKRNLMITSKRMNIDKIRMTLEKLKNSEEFGDMKLFVIDYVQNIPFRTGFKGDKIGEYKHMSSQINEICSELEICCIALSQSNDRDKSNDTNFHINDIKGAGSWAEDAFYVVGMGGVQGETMRKINVVKNKRAAIGNFQVELDFVNRKIMPWEAR